eukprot:CAMPEP_0175077422 /NCGR_PEP_ID=MMETSP0052_2-20121109/23386_1 /TAXON_ID=51329 ORGANISM="Polytomella parva, Strain SAG 63-3" /NCGR_SAMPLE_ID=MMETSP0052_2 /ASSEMBLY_ACC=CAM_ASM_000194 /LENGTH=202 /DNA_ID=CAMNT_0016346895 /DNA_START=113 /DNA_END=721 /DNA_ORIENTATION=+
MSRFHGLTASNPERQTIAAKVQEGVDLLNYQLRQLDIAVDKASENPERFNLTPEELASRRVWISTTRRQVQDMTETLTTAKATPASFAMSGPKKPSQENSDFLANESEKQVLVMRRQDADLDDIEKAVTRIGHIGKEMGQELGKQAEMLEELDQDVDTTSNKLKAAQKKVQELIRRSGSNTQLVLIGVLIVILIILCVFAFY